MPPFNFGHRKEKRSTQVTVHMTPETKAEIYELKDRLEYAVLNDFLLDLLEEGLVKARKAADSRVRK